MSLPSTSNVTSKYLKLILKMDGSHESWTIKTETPECGDELTLSQSSLERSDELNLPDTSPSLDSVERADDLYNPRTSSSLDSEEPQTSSSPQPSSFLQPSSSLTSVESDHASLTKNEEIDDVKVKNEPPDSPTKYCQFTIKKDICSPDKLTECTRYDIMKTDDVELPTPYNPEHTNFVPQNCSLNSNEIVETNAVISKMEDPNLVTQGCVFTSSSTNPTAIVIKKQKYPPYELKGFSKQGEETKPTIDQSKTDQTNLLTQMCSSNPITSSKRQKYPPYQLKSDGSTSSQVVETNARTPTIERINLSIEHDIVLSSNSSNTNKNIKSKKVKSKSKDYTRKPVVKTSVKSAQLLDVPDSQTMDNTNMGMSPKISNQMNPNVSSDDSRSQSLSSKSVLMCNAMTQIDNPESDESDVPRPSTESKKPGKFSVDTSRIKKSSNKSQNGDLTALDLDVYDQEELETGIMAQVDEALAKQEAERLRRIAEKEIKGVNEDLRLTKEELYRLDKIISSYTKQGAAQQYDERHQLRAATSQRQNKLRQLKKLNAKYKSLSGHLDPTSPALSSASSHADGAAPSTTTILGQPIAETETERLIRLGEMTPFGSVVHSQQKPSPDANSEPQPSTSGVQRSTQSYEMTDFGSFLTSEDDKTVKKSNAKHKHVSKDAQLHNVKKLKLSASASFNSTGKAAKSKVRDGLHGKISIPKPARLQHSAMLTSDRRYKQSSASNDAGKSVIRKQTTKHKTVNDDDKSVIRKETTKHRPVKDDDEYVPDESDSEEEYSESEHKIKKPLMSAKGGKVTKKKTLARDDGNAAYYEKRIKQYKYETLLKQSEDVEEDVSFSGELKITADSWNKLYRYQKTCVQWLWELHCQGVGGIVGDEMGLGKTIQLIAFFGALRHSRLRNDNFKYEGLGPSLIVCPATVMMQWVREFHKWARQFRVAILHSSGSFITTEAALIQNLVKCNGVIVTSYSSVVIHQKSLLKHDWHYVVLDEGHKIRNPDAQVTLCVKQFRTPHRLILSGSPIQNNLRELWSLIDFVFPGKLGTLPDFMTHFAVPITQGGYSNATEVQVQTAYKCACVLRDTINPYLLRRMKADVKMYLDLPTKNEQVLFCRLTEEQRDVYQEYLDSEQCRDILCGRYKVFVGLQTLRKICNHPDIANGGPRILVGEEIDETDPELQYGYFERSGKMIVVKSLLKIWQQQGHRVLLFSQSREMLNIIESFVKAREMTYMRMDGNTSIQSRQTLIHNFNNDPSIFLFLLTTRVGGLGVNLTGADRVVIYDPDWNPSTDLQARERAWRIGQDKQVTIYRLLTTGTIEEKIYHRQIFKQFLVNRVLQDPKQRRFFKSNDLLELFTLGTSKDKKHKSETSAIFAGTGSDVTVPRKVTKAKTEKKKVEDKCERIRQLAKSLSQKIQKGTYTGGEGDGDVEVKDENGDRKREKHKKHAKFEGVEVPNLVKNQPFSMNQDDDVVEKKSKNKKHDDYVLHTLFAKSGVEDALQHDTIINSSRADYALVDNEADRVAKQAAIALKKSRSHCNPAITGIPTWTGAAVKKPRFGQKKNTKLLPMANKKDTTPDKSSKPTTPTPSPAKFFDGRQAGSRDNTLSATTPSNLSSSRDLLTRMRQRNSLVTNTDPHIDTGDNTDDPNYKQSGEYSLITEIRDHISCRCRVDGQATTAEILDVFAPQLPPNENAKFKAMLNQICTFEREDDVGIWKLKPEYR